MSIRTDFFISEIKDTESAGNWNYVFGIFLFTFGFDSDILSLAAIHSCDPSVRNDLLSNSFLVVYMENIMFTEFEEKILSCGYFDIIFWGEAWIELMSQDTKHYWIMKKFDKEGFPGLVLYHSYDGENYHVHFCYEDTDALPAVSEIMSHDRYYKKKMKRRNKITQVSNRKLLMVICR